eukprot:Seg397.14 transcript_id=Seg397.14/GoldUCD/mRNA.D3Y31 product="hypothetical protein" protein_id=Seg397.14/GoldUCD/D3Y31
MRDKKKRKDGMQYLHVTYPKFKYGDEVVREVSVNPTYGYVQKLRTLLFSTPLEILRDSMRRQEETVPDSLTSQFTERADRSTAIEMWQSRKMKTTSLFPTGKREMKSTL